MVFVPSPWSQCRFAALLDARPRGPIAQSDPQPTHRPREPYSGRASSATGALAGSSGLRRSEPQLHPPLLARRSALDPPGGVVERPAAAGALRHPSERLPIEQLDYNLLFRWFVGLSPDDRVWDPTSFSKNRERLQQGKVFDKFMAMLLEQPKVKIATFGTGLTGTLSRVGSHPPPSRKPNRFHGQKTGPSGKGCLASEQGRFPRLFVS